MLPDRGARGCKSADKWLGSKDNPSYRHEPRERSVMYLAAFSRSAKLPSPKYMRFLKDWQNIHRLNRIGIRTLDKVAISKDIFM